MSNKGIVLSNKKGIMRWVLFVLLFAVLFSLIIFRLSLLKVFVPFAKHPQKAPVTIKKLYWFIPDGMRAEPYLFDVFEWAKEGKLPNIKKLMDEGSYGYCRPVYPGHTPVNFATLFTGSYPEVHGVSDAAMHTEGNPLIRPSITGFSSTAKRVEPMWVTLEKQGRTVALLSIPGSTPPELSGGYTLVGRWGGWGANFYSVNFEELGDASARYKQGRHSRPFYFGPPLTIFKNVSVANNWRSPPQSYSEAKEVALDAWGAQVNAYIYDSTNDSKINYDRIAFSCDKQSIIADLKQGEWSRWLPITLKWQGLNINTQFKIRVIKLGKDGFYRIRFLYNALNETVAKPDYLAKDLTDNVGPMVDYVDNFPPQLIFYDEDKGTFLEESDMSFLWHHGAVSYFLKKYKPDIFLHSIYSPNQMLTSRWWLGYVDPQSPRYKEKSQEEREKLWLEVQGMYKKIDDIIGEYLKNADENTVIAVCADHGAIWLHKHVHLNNLFATKGWLMFKIDSASGEPVVDWQNSKVVYLNFGNIYINPSGLQAQDGNWHRGSGPEYEQMKKEVMDMLLALEDEDGTKPVAKVVSCADAGKTLRLPADRVGDLIAVNRPGYACDEEMSEKKEIFSLAKETGYKQAIIPDDCAGMWFPFIVKGPGVKKNFFLGSEPLKMVDLYPTVMTLIGADIPDFVQGKAITGIFTDEFKKNRGMR